VVYASDAKFQKDYKNYFHESGCTGPKERIAMEYNRIMFEYLTRTYGKKWIKSARKDILGLKHYKQNIKKRWLEKEYADKHLERFVSKNEDFSFCQKACLDLIL
jgi:hypothetical protein